MERISENEKDQKVISILLMLAVFFGLNVTAFAAGNGKIIVDNPKTGETYTAYKIFDVVYDTNKSAYSYTISGTSEWFDVVASKDDVAGTVTSRITNLTIEKTVIDNTYVVSMNGAFSAAAFAETLKANTAGKTGTTLTIATGETAAKAENLDLGYYFIKSTNGALCNLTTTDPSVTIHDKNDVPFEKTDDKTDVEIGETVAYTITGKVPDTTGFTTYTYKITDTMSEGLTFGKDVVVKIGNDDVTGACTITYTPNNNTPTGFELMIPVKNYQDKIGAAITVTYSATVNEKAVKKIEKNHAVLTYSNAPADSTETDDFEDEETVYSAGIVIDKYEIGMETKKLSGASFVLYRNEVEAATGQTIKKYYKYTAAAGTQEAKVEWVADQGQATVKTTDTNGETSFDGLKNGTYFLEETAAPAGYNLLKTPVEVEVAGNDQAEASLTSTAKVANAAGTHLPSTGGIGTTIFYVLGGILVAGAIILLVIRCRRPDEEK